MPRASPASRCATGWRWSSRTAGSSISASASRRCARTAISATGRSSSIPRTASSATAGSAIGHHADAFGMIRGGRIDVTVLGAYEVAANGDFANWKMAGQKGGGIGGAMDLAACAKHVFVAMEQTTRGGSPRLVERCAIPATARGVVNLVITNCGLFEITPEGMALKEIAPGVTVEEIKATTGCTLLIPREVPPVRLRA